MGGQGSTEHPVEILWVIAAKTARRIGKQRLRMDQPLIQSHAVNEGFERRAGRTPGTGSIHLSGYGGVRKTGRPHEPPDLHTRPMDEQRRRIVQAITPSPCRESGNGPLHKPLQPAVDTGIHRLPTPRQRKRLARNVRSPERQPRRTIHPERRQGPPQGETRRAKRSSTGDLEIRAVQRRAPDRILRHDGKGKAFGPGKTSGGGAEINARRRADAFDIAAIRCEVEIRLKDFPLAIMVFILEGASHLRELAQKRGRGQAEPEPGHLHGDRGTAHTPCPAEHPRRSPEQGQRIDAGVPVEIPILVKQHRPHHLGRDLVQPDTDTVFFIFGKAQPEQVPVPIQHQRRKQHAVQKRRFGTQDKPAPERRDRQQQRQHEGESDGFAHMKSFGKHFRRQRASTP